MPNIYKQEHSGHIRQLLVEVEFDESTTGTVSLSNDLRSKFGDYLSLKPIGSKTYNKFILYKIDYSFVEGVNSIVVHDPQFRDSTIQNALVSIAFPIKLDKCIISITDELYETLKDYSDSELYEIFSRFQIGIVNDGDILKFGKVLLCEPISQGLLSQDTKITLVKGLKNIEVEDENELDISSYLTSKVTELEIEVESLKELNYSIKDDEELLALASNFTLSKIGVLNGDYVEIKFNKYTKIVRIQSFIEPHSFSEKLYLSPIFLINNGSPSKVIVSKTNKSLNNVPIANSINIVKLASPISLSRIYQQSYLSNLKTFFKIKQRIVSIGDLIPITFDSIIAKNLTNPEVSSPLGNPDSIVWFKILEINGVIEQDYKQFIVDPRHTSMSQSGIISQAPPDLTYNWDKYLKLQANFSFEGFEHAEKLSKLIKSSMISPNLQTSVLLKSGNRNVGKTFIVENLALKLGFHYATVDGYEVLNSSSDYKTIGVIRGRLDRAVAETSKMIVFIKHLEAISSKQEQPGLLSALLIELIDDYTKSGAIFIASTNDEDKISEDVRSKFKFEIEVPVPNENQRLAIFRYLIENEPAVEIRNDVSFQSLALQSAGLTPRDLLSIFSNAKASSLDRLEDLSETLKTDIEFILNNNPISLTPLDFENSINDARDKLSDSIGAPKIPNVKWEDIGGLDVVKDEILDTIDLPLKHPELFANGVKKRSGILFYGPPGTGKTLLAKAIATNFSLNFFSIKGPELLNMYIGESEANVRKVFQKARDAKPCVVFFDELDSVAPKRGNQSDSGGVMDRIVSQLLSELDGMSDGDGGDGVFVVGATNRPDLLDEALLRPGRFDKMLYLGIADTHEKQKNILEALTRKFKMRNVDLKKISEECPLNFTGADFYALCSDSMLNAMTRVAGEADKKIKKFNKDKKDPVSTRWWFDNVATEDDTQVFVEMTDFLKAQRELIPSVSKEELAHYLRVRKNFEGN